MSSLTRPLRHVQQTEVTSGKTHRAKDQHAHDHSHLLRGDKHATNNHHTCTKQPLADLPLVEEHACPDNRENSTQLEERRHIPDETECNRREAKERRDTGEQDGGGESTRVGTEPLPGSRGTRPLLCSS